MKKTKPTTTDKDQRRKHRQRERDRESVREKLAEQLELRETVNLATPELSEISLSFISFLEEFGKLTIE